MSEIFKETIIDTVKLIPFLFITYLIMEYLEHKTSSKSREKMKKSGKIGPIVGGVLGAFPQCGFSISATNLYVGRIISMGTLIAVYLSTSDEMIPVFISESVSVWIILKVLAIKVVVGIVMGILVDLIFSSNSEKNGFEEMCEQENCECSHSILKSSLKHTINITFFIFIITFILNILIYFVGEDTISGFVQNKPILGPILAGIVGLIPNCAASVIIVELYLNSMINSGTLIAGLLVNAGLGLLVLFRMNKNLKENLKIVSILYVIGVCIGIILELAKFTL